MDKLQQYRLAHSPIPDSNLLWPLYGAGFENLGLNGEPLLAPTPQIGPDQLLVRHDATGLCFSDIKVIKAGQSHPRIYRDISKEPVVLGHEISMTVVNVGENLKGEYTPGDRFTIQADIFINGVGYAYGYEIQGGLSQFNVIDQRILNGDDGNYLLPIKPTTGYAESALTEPWACVIAAYQLVYRQSMKAGGTTWIIGTGDNRPFNISQGFDQFSHPSRLILSNVPPIFRQWLEDRALALGIEVKDQPEIKSVQNEGVDDIIFLGADPELIEIASPLLAAHGVAVIMAEKPMSRKVNVDVGRIHYNRWVYIGNTGLDISKAYSDIPVRSTLRSEGKTWFVGAGGPMGRMHVQRAIQVNNGPKTIVCTDVSDMRLNDLCTAFSDEAKAKGINFVCLNPTHKEEYEEGFAPFAESGFDDIVVLAPVGPVIAGSADFLAPEGVLNVFAGLSRGVMVNLDLSGSYLKQTRIIGHSASSIDDLRLMLHQAETGELSPNRSVAAIGSLSAAKDGLHSVLDTSFPGKVVIYPQIMEFPLTSLVDLESSLPSVFRKLKDGREWTNEAEEEFLRIMLP